MAEVPADRQCNCVRARPRGAPADPAALAGLLTMCDEEFGWDIDTFIALTRRVLPSVVAERDRLAVQLADERTKVLAEVFDAISDRLGIAGDQTARMICLAAIKRVAASPSTPEETP